MQPKCRHWIAYAGGTRPRCSTSQVRLIFSILCYFFEFCLCSLQSLTVRPSCFRGLSTNFPVWHSFFFLNPPPTTPLTIYEWIFQTNMYVFFANRYCGRMINGLFLRSGILFTNVQVLRSRDNFTHFLHIWIFSFFFVSNDDSQFTNKFLLQISIAAICFAQMKLFDKLHFEFTIYSCLYLYLYFFSSFHSHQSLTLRHL